MTKKLTFCAMMSVMAILCLLLSNIMQTTTVFLYLFSTLFTYICTEEHGIKYGALTATVINLAGFMLVNQKSGIFAYIIIASYYPVVKHIIEHFDTKMYFKTLLKLLFALITATVTYFILKSLFTFAFPIFTMYIAGIIIFLIYDKALTAGIRFYVLKLRKYK